MATSYKTKISRLRNTYVTKPIHKYDFTIDPFRISLHMSYGNFIRVYFTLSRRLKNTAHSQNMIQYSYYWRLQYILSLILGVH
jgi:hypothetical protein